MVSISAHEYFQLFYLYFEWVSPHHEAGARLKDVSEPAILE